MASGRQNKVSVEACCTPDCDNPGDYSRGNCCGCYKRYHAAVSNGETTWDKLVKKGVTKKPYPPRSPASKALAG